MAAVKIVLGLWIVLIQSGQGSRVFEAASVKSSDPSSRGGSTFSFTTGGGLEVRNGTLRGLVETAYDIREFQIIGGPGWVNSEHYDISAKSPAGEPQDIPVTRLRLQALLAERFHLIAHRETRNLPEYVLVVARGGTKLIDRGGWNAERTGIQSGCGQMTGTRASMANLTVTLSRQLNRPVLDQTGLSGRYDFELQWTPDVGPCSTAVDSTALLTAPSIFTAIEEKLGLKLDATRGPVETIVIDQAEKPDAN